MRNQDPRATPAGIAYVRRKEIKRELKRRQAEAMRARSYTFGLRTLEEIDAQQDDLAPPSLWPLLSLAILGLAVAVAVFLVR